MVTSAAACRIFVGDLGNEVNDDVLQKSFQKFTTLLKAKVVRDKRTNKTKGQRSQPTYLSTMLAIILWAFQHVELLPPGASNGSQSQIARCADGYINRHMLMRNQSLW